MHKLYPRLALNNIKRNGKTYFPFLLTCIATVMMYYIMHVLSIDKGNEEIHQSVSYMLKMGVNIIAVFSVLFLFYTNSFLIKRRKKELGLYQILGMEKKHIGKVLFFETFFIGGSSLAVGLIGGAVVSKLIYLFLLNLLQFPVPLSFQIPAQSLVAAVKLFAGIHLLLFISNLVQVQMSSPIALLKGGQTGEKEPKTNWIMTIIGIIALGIGYGIALLVKSPMSAIFLFFIAVIFVMIGTYSLFTAGSIALLKVLKKNKAFYYKTNHFVALSGMIYRMKQNAVGLANICILSSAVLVMISTTGSLYIGREDLIRTRFPQNVSINYYTSQPQKESQLQELITQKAQQHDVGIEDFTQYHFKRLGLLQEGNRFTNVEDTYITMTNASQVSEAIFVTQQDYNRMTQKTVSLESNEVLVFSYGADYGMDNMELGNTKLIVKEELQEFPGEKKRKFVSLNGYMIVVRDEGVIAYLVEQIMKEPITPMDYHIGFDVAGEKQTIIDFANDLDASIEQIGIEGYYLENAQREEASFFMDYGGLFFLGIFLGALFFMATALIIYYKQVSEGYDDRVRFDIMQKVGMSQKEIRKAIKSQVLLVFFLPLAVAVIHIAVAFQVIIKLLALLNLSNISLFVTCSIVTVGIFAVVYAVVYALTARVYYKIVQ